MKFEKIGKDIVVFNTVGRPYRKFRSLMGVTHIFLGILVFELAFPDFSPRRIVALSMVTATVQFVSIYFLIYRYSGDKPFLKKEKPWLIGLVILSFATCTGVSTFAASVDQITAQEAGMLIRILLLVHLQLIRRVVKEEYLSGSHIVLILGFVLLTSELLVKIVGIVLEGSVFGTLVPVVEDMVSYISALIEFLKP